MSRSQRKGEPPGPHLRSDRCVLVHGRWFITTREGIDVGPYDAKELAEADARHIAMMLEDIDDPRMASVFIREFARRSRGPAKRKSALR